MSKMSESESSISSDEEFDDEIDKINTNESAITSADAWGKKKIAYYGSHADKDFGGWAEDEAEALELEEEDAISRQKKLDAGIQAVDFDELLASEDDETESAVIIERNGKMPTDGPLPKSLNTTDQIGYLIKHSASFDHFVKEFNERKAQFEELKPILDDILSRMNGYDIPFTQQIKAIIAAYTQYLQSYSMFFYLKDSTPLEKFKNVENHPVLDVIMKQYSLMKQVDDFIEKNHHRLIKVADRLKEDPSYAETVAHPEPPKKKKNKIFSEKVVENGSMEEDIGNIFARMARGEGKKSSKVAPIGPPLDENPVEDVEEDKKRKITYEMQKNRGLTVKRKKGISHSRTKKRQQFKKAIHVRRSQVPDVKREVTKYDGERRGIRAGIIRSTKLKA